MEPDVLITAPLSGSTVRAALVTPVAVNLSGGLTGVAKITLHVNGAQKATDLSSPYGFSWKPAGSLVGTEPVLEVRAWNSKAMVVATDRITVLVLGRD
jgi:hypothetical protein